MIACSGQLSAPIAPAPQRLVDLLLEHDAVPELVGAEHVGREHVTTTVTDTEVGVDANCHHAPRVTVGPRAPHAAVGVRFAAVQHISTVDG